MTATNFLDGIRTFFISIDRLVYSLIGDIYSLIVKIAEQELISPDSIYGISNKIYSFLAIFMLFKVSFSLINYIINPDSLSDKEKGGGKMITNIVITFALIIVTPLGFDLLYEAQTALLTENIIPNIILSDSVQTGTSNTFIIDQACLDNGLSPVEISPAVVDEETGEVVYNPGEYISMMTIRPFFQIDDQFENDSDEVKKFIAATNYCQATTIDTLLKEKIVNYPNKKNEIYRVNYGILVSSVVGVIVLLIFVGFCLDVAARSVKLVFLQAIASIPIVSFMDPASAKKGLFSKWLKEVGITWADLFIRLIAIYFSIFLISKIQLESNDAMVNLFIILGILIFAKKLPDILKKMLNIDVKGDFTLNPFKKFQDSALGGKKIMGTATGLTSAAIGGLTSFRGSDIREKFKNAGKGFKTGLTGGYKNPTSIKGLMAGTEPYKEIRKKQKEAEDKLERFDRLTDDGRKYFERAKVLDANGNPTYKVEKKLSPIDGKKYDVRTKNYDYDLTKLFKHDDYIQSYNDVEQAKKNVDEKKEALQKAQSKLARLNANPYATSLDIARADNDVVKAESALEKANGVLTDKKERHKILQERYDGDAKIENAVKEFKNRHKDEFENADAQEQWYDENGNEYNLKDAEEWANRAISDANSGTKTSTVPEVYKDAYEISWNEANKNKPSSNSSVENSDEKSTTTSDENVSRQSSYSNNDYDSAGERHMEQVRQDIQEDLKDGVDQVYSQADTVKEATINGEMSIEEHEASMAGDENIIDKISAGASKIIDKIFEDKTSDEELHYTSSGDRIMEHLDENGHINMSSEEMFREEFERNERRRQEIQQEEQISSQNNFFKRRKDDE